MESAGGNLDSRIIGESTVELTEALKLEAVAQGITGSWQVDYLRVQGCDTGATARIPQKRCKGQLALDRSRFTPVLSSTFRMLDLISTRNGSSYSLQEQFG